jgi:acetolactate synthase-1/2/3 large subunit
MKNRFDGGEAIVEGFRKLGVDYILSSPGTEWAPVWEAMADQIHRRKEGPKLLDVWHETLAVDMATGYTLATGRIQGVLLHAGSGLLQGAMGYPRRLRRRGADGGDLRRVDDLRRAAGVRSGRPMD